MKCLTAYAEKCERTEDYLLYLNEKKECMKGFSDSKEKIFIIFPFLVIKKY